ncbi:hypothetical protein [Pedobacter foliorum]|uniref:hypothetical protein n=1 Tax=Pedobacter foliorum TaxID=2739058 RepID=UPI001567082F|nr:hypothetical protein [Pedobacter foliorum]NRF37825.1 hypothetical protein [Pedobacter foliorum]
MMKKNIEGIPEFNRRILNWIELLLPSSQEKRALSIEYGVTGTSLLNHLSKSREYKTLSDIKKAITSFGQKAIRYLEDDNSFDSGN